MPNNTKKDIRLQRLVEAAKEISARSDNPMLAKMYAYAVEKFAEGNAHYLRFMNELEEPPVDIETFLDSEDFMASTDLTLWPVVRQAIVDICKDWYKGLEGGAIKEVLLTGATGCVDMQTEFLSRSGWKRICDYEEGDEVLQYHEDGTASWVKPTEYIERPVSHFYHFKSKTVDQMLTAGHRMIFRAYKSGKITERSAEYVANRHNERANGYSAGKFICSYDLQGGKGLLLTDDQIKVYVAAYALGRHTTENGLQVECKIRCPEKAKALAALLKSTRTPYSSNLGSNGVDKVYFALPKRMDNYSGWYSADKRQLQLIAEQMLLWTGVKGRSRLYTYEQGIADFIQHVFTSLGKRATITEIERSEGKSYGEYCVNICSSDSTGILSSNKPTIPMVPVLGVKCYCFTVPTGMWVMRRSGKIVVTGNTGKCLPGRTEYLSPEGWKRIDEYDGGEVAQYHKDGSTSYVSPSSYINQPSNGFLRIANSRFSLEATGQHRVAYRKRTNKGGLGDLRISTFGDIAEEHEGNASGFTGVIPATFAAPLRDGLPLTDDEVRLMVAVMADGSFSKEDSARGSLPNYCVFHIKKDYKKQRLVDLLKKCGIKFNRYKREDGYWDVAFLAPERNKTYQGWWAASPAQLQIIRDEVLRWDGSETRREFYTCDKHTADFIQYVGSATGNRTSVHVLDRVGQKRGGYTRKSLEYTVRFLQNQHHGLSAGNDRAAVDRVEGGREYCFTVPTGMFLIRQDGHISATGNSEISKVVTAYFLHVLGCMKNPQKFYDLPSATSIVIPIQAAKPNVTKKIVYAPLRKYVETMPWFIRKMRPNKLIESEMLFEGKNIRVVQGGSESDAILGEAVIGNITDEINFMNVVENSKKAGFVGGRSGNYDQAQQIYDAVTKRRKGRFLSQGPHVGVQIFSSSRRYKGDFTDRRQAQVEELQEPNVYIYDKAQYEAAPSHRYSGEIFWLALTGESNSEIRIVEDESEIPLGATILEVPVEYLEDFKKDASGSLRDIIGKSTHAISPFFRKRQVIQNIFDRGRELGLTSILHKDNVILGIEGMPRVRRERYCTNPSKPRYVHIDLSLTSDSCGIAMLCYEGMVVKERKSGVVERLPSASVDFACSITPDHAAEIDIAEVRTWVKQLKDVYGYPIKAVTYDGWQSAESRQQWRKTGMKTGIISVDKSSSHYKNLRDAMADGRIACHEQEVLYDELCQLEYDEKKDKVDHPPVGSKDVADALCGAFSNLLNRSSTWVGAFSKMEDPAMEGRQMLDDRFDGERSA